MTYNRNLADLDFCASNERYDFYVSKTQLGDYWYTYAMIKDTCLCSSKTGFNSRKSAEERAEDWAKWMK